MNITDLPTRMQPKITITESGCWHWTAAVTGRGYGAWGVNGVSKSTHRVAYEMLVGPIPDGLQIDHLCRNKRCCNPDHLEPVTALVNTRRRPDINKTHCINGHEMTPENTVIKPHADGYKMRNCRICANESQRKTGARSRKRGLPDDDPRHGTGNGYRTHGCRCDPCKVAQSSDHAAWRARRAAS